MTTQAIKVFLCVPKATRKTLTIDNGKEFSLFKDIEKKTGIAIYFADPYASYQFGLNENTNKLLRQYFPKEMDFRQINDQEPALKVKMLNHRPQKSKNA